MVEYSLPKQVTDTYDKTNSFHWVKQAIREQTAGIHVYTILEAVTLTASDGIRPGTAWGVGGEGFAREGAWGNILERGKQVLCIHLSERSDKGMCFLIYKLYLN